MSRYLLDEHIIPRVATTAAAEGVDVSAVAASSLAGSDDLTVLRAAIAEGRILVTYDVGDFVVLLGVMAREGTSVPGVVFVDRASISTSDVGGLATALVALDRMLAAGDADASAGIFLTRR